jgi:mono/diheme cytochrome c family protein
MDFIPRLRALFLVSLAMAGLSSCGQQSPDDMASDTQKSDVLKLLQFGHKDHAAPCATGLQAFQSTIYSTILRPQCAECHDGTGSGPASGPPHSSADPVAAYQEASNYVDFTQPLDQSFFVQKVQQKHWLKNDSKAVGTTVALMTQALQAWWDQGENACPDYASAQTAGAAIPAGLPLAPAEQYVPMSWKLDSLGAPFTGSVFQVEIQQLTAPTATTAGAYRVRKPRIATPQTGLSVTGIQFFINGKTPTNAVGWENLEAKIAGHIAANAPAGSDVFNQAPVLSGRPLILLQDLAQGDVLSVAFSGVQVIPAPQCQNLAGFQKAILPVIQQSSCIGCHNGGTPAEFNGGSRLTLAGTDAAICAAVLERTDNAHSDASPFYQIGFLNENDHPPSVPAPSTFSLDWETWVQAEQAAESDSFANFANLRTLR